MRLTGSTRREETQVRNTGLVSNQERSVSLERPEAMNASLIESGVEAVMEAEVVRVMLWPRGRGKMDGRQKFLVLVSEEVRNH